MARLLKSSRQKDDLDHQNLTQMSTIARNKLVLEHVVGARNLKDWKAQILEEIHSEQREDNQHKRTQSQSIVKRKRPIIKRIL